MKEQFIVAQNAFTVSAPEGHPAWRALKRRFSPFAATPAEMPVLEIDITTIPLPQCDAETIYEPVHSGIGIISARASRQADGCLVIEFRHVADQRTRLRMIMSAEFNRADIIIAPDGDGNDPHLLSHAMMVAFMLATCGNGTLLIHASSVIYEGKAYLFQGKSGTGKSTHAALWTANIEGAELLNDDNPVIRFSDDGVAMAYGSPWSGKTPCYRNLSAPIGAMVRIVRAPENELRRLSPLMGYASLTASVFFLPFLNERLRDIRHSAIERLACSVPCCEMHCRPDKEAALICSHELRSQSYEL